MGNERVDVAIIGGGVMGCSVAYHLKTLDPGLAVLVLERDPSYAEASSALSASSIRQQFSSPINIALSQHGIAFLRDAANALAVGDERPDLSLVERGYLYLATAAGEATLRAVHEVQRACGAEVALLEPAALARRFPWLAVGDLALGSLGLRGEGWFDGYSLLQALRRKAGSLGAAWRATEVTGLRLAGRRVQAIECGDGHVVECGVAVNAAGPHAARIGRMAGVELPVAAVRHCVFVFECRDPVEGCPLVIDPSGVWFRPDAQRFITGIPPRDPGAPENATLDVDHALFEDTIWPVLAHRVTAFEAIRRTSAWAGFYEVNTFDQNAIIGAAPEVANLMLINGFSGHGMQQAPAAGRALAELIVHGAYRTLDVGALGPGRIAAGSPLRELNII